MRLSRMWNRDIISAYDGCYLGSLRHTDIAFDPHTGKILSMIIPERTGFTFWRAGSEIMIPWHRIRKFGQDSILVDTFSQSELR